MPVAASVRTMRLPATPAVVAVTVTTAETAADVAVDGMSALIAVTMLAAWVAGVALIVTSPATARAALKVKVCVPTTKVSFATGVPETVMVPVAATETGVTTASSPFCQTVRLLWQPSAKFRRFEESDQPQTVRQTPASRVSVRLSQPFTVSGLPRQKRTFDPSRHPPVEKSVSSETSPGASSSGIFTGSGARGGASS